MELKPRVFLEKGFWTDSWLHAFCSYRPRYSSFRNKGTHLSAAWMSLIGLMYYYRESPDDCLVNMFLHLPSFLK